MIRRTILKYLSVRRSIPLAAIGLALLASSAYAQYTAPLKDTTKKSNTMELTVLRMEPVYAKGDTSDNSGIDFRHQFGGAKPLPDSLYLPQEKHLRNIRQLTFAGENAEAYLSPDEKHVSFQAHGVKENECDQIYMMTLDGKNVKRISTGRGRTTCSYFLPSGDRILYASTHASYGGACPPPADPSKGYVWPLYGAYDIFVADTNGNLKGRLTDNTAYDAEATVSPKGDRIIFTSTRSGDIELYSMKIDGSDVRQLTRDEGYDGGAFFSEDGSKIVYRASRPQGSELKEYRDLLKDGLIHPHSLELFVMDADGSNKRQVTHIGSANFAPYWHPDGKRIIFASNHGDPKGRNFDLYMVNVDGSGLERITYNPTFDAFPVFTRDGKHLIFCSNRNGSSPTNTNIFIADWVD